MTISCVVRGDVYKRQVRKQYKEAVNERIQRGYPFASSETPWEYWQEVQDQEPNDQFKELTHAYNKERYRP